MLEKGDKVVYKNPDNGYTHDQEKAREHLELGQTYTLDHVDIDAFYTAFYLIEVPGIAFNSVLFE